jgi:hypothetical protein
MNRLKTGSETSVFMLPELIQPIKYNIDTHFALTYTHRLKQVLVSLYKAILIKHMELFECAA